MSSAESILAVHDELRQPLIRYLLSLGLSADESQDVAQEAFLRLHRHLVQGGPGQNLRAWLFRVAHNEARNRQQTYERRFAAPMEEAAEPADAVTPEEAFLTKERRRRLSAAFKSLSQVQRACMRLRAEGLRYREIGEVLGLPTSTVADTIERAVRALAESCND